MQRSTRLIGILVALQNRDQTLTSLATRFECSTKTIQRDLAAMTELGIPIRTQAGIGGGIHLGSGWWLGAPNLNDEELRVLLVGLESMPETDARARLVEKLRAAIRPHVFDSIAEEPTFPTSVSEHDEPNADVLATIRGAFDRGMWLRIEYAGSSTQGERTALPLEIHLQQGHWYLTCLDQRSGQSRRFRLDRIRSARPCLAPEDADVLIRNHISHNPEPDVLQFVIRLTPRGTWFCADHPYLRIGLDGDTLTFSRPKSDLSYLANELLRMGTDCVVIEPEALRIAMRDRIATLHDHLSRKLDT